MEEENSIKKLELNNNSLDNFDNLISTKLDEIKELKITSLTDNSKLLNIISLCSNVEILKIENNQRMDTSKILSNIFSKGKVKELHLNDVKFPSPEILKKFKNLKRLSLNNIRLCSLKLVLDGFEEKDNLDFISISNSDLMKSKINSLEGFKDLSNIELDNVSNGDWTDLNFLRRLNYLSNLKIHNQNIPIKEINNLLKVKCIKNINVNVLDDDNKIIKNFEFKIEDKKTYLKFQISDIESINEKVELYMADKIEVLINKKIEGHSYIEILKRYKKKVEILISNFSVLNSKQASKFKENLKLEELSVKDGNNFKKYDMETFIDIRLEIDKIISNVSNHVEQAEKVIEIYKYLGEEFKIAEKEYIDLKQKACPKNKFSFLLKNCLQCMDIKTNIISGDDEINSEKGSWNQVEIDGIWYNLDLSLDLDNLKKNKAEYCLLGDESFLETHTPKYGKNNYCPEDFDQKKVTVFLKTGLFNDKMIKSYFWYFTQKIKNLFRPNENKILALPSGDEKK